MKLKKGNWITIGKYFSGLVGLVLLLMLILPQFFKERINLMVRDYLDQQITTNLSFSDISLTFFRQFPSLTVSLDDIEIEGANDFKEVPFLSAKELSFGINLFSLFRPAIEVKSIYLGTANINILRDLDGNSNFEVFETSDEDKVSETSENELAIDIQKIRITNSDFLYKDTDLDFICLAEKMDYQGNGKFSGNLLSLNSDIKITHFDIIYEGLAYLDRKNINANLRTIIDTETTALNFERNSLIINKLPVDFIGKLEFITGGYDMNFVLESVNTDMKDIFSLVPDQLGPWLQKTRMQGKGDLRGSLSGLYLSSEGLFPDLILTLSLRDGNIRHQGAPRGLEDLFMDFGITIPDLDFDKTKINLDTLTFLVGDGYVHSKFNLEGFDPAHIQGQTDLKLDLRILDRALGIDAIEMKGNLALNFLANGTYQTEWIPNTFRNPQYRTVSIPKFDIKSQLLDGFIQWKDKPIPISDIAWQLDINANDSLYQNISINLEGLACGILEQNFGGHFKLSNLQNMEIDAGINGQLDLSLIPNIYPLEDGYEFQGNAIVDFKANGQYLMDQKIFPVTNTHMEITNGFIRSPFSPYPIEDIQIQLDVTSNEGSFYDLKFDLAPVSFNFVDQKFNFAANLKNLDDIQYDIESKGRVDLGKLYQVFGVEGYDVDGYFVTNLSLKGLQSDALEGKFDALKNQGSVDFEKIMLRADFLPEPLLIQHGRLKLEQDRFYLENLRSDYHRNEFTADGFLYNLTGYLTEESELLKGSLNISSPEIHVEDFLFYAPTEAPKVDSLGRVQGVVMLPQNIMFQLNADVKEVHYDSLLLENLQGSLKVENAALWMENTGFDLVGARFDMEGNYQPQSPFRANFEYDLKGRGFDIQKAYREIKLFSELVPAASYMEGIASLDYKLSGSFNANMDPILPSIKGEGILGLDDVRLRGFRLMNSIATRTENNELQDPNLKQVRIRSSIANNLITIERTRMRIAGFRPRFEGQVSLDGDLSIAFRLGLPPFGIFGIPIKITGNATDFEMEIGRITEEDELEEIEEEIEVEDEIEEALDDEKLDENNNLGFHL